MPNIDKVVKTVMHEIADGKAAVREVMYSALKNQEIIIAQNKCMTNLLAEMNDKLSMLTEHETLARKDEEITTIDEDAVE